MHMKWKHYKYSVDEFCDIVPDGQKADLIDGVIYMASPDSLEANDLFVFVLTLMRIYASRQKLGKVLGSRAAFQIDEHSAPEPDIAFVRAKRVKNMHGGYFKGPPDIAVEIVSPSSAKRDYLEKRAKYQAGGVSEYWIIDESLRRVTLLRLDSMGLYQRVRPSGKKYRSEVLTGFWFRPEWFWADPLPDELETYSEIVAGSSSR